MRVVVWNCHGAGSASDVWDYLLELDPEIALLQEVRSLPAKIQSRYEWRGEFASKANGTSQRFQTGILARRFGERIGLRGTENWVNEELERFAGNLVGYEVLTSQGEQLSVMSVYSPACPDVWVGDLLWASLMTSEIKEKRWIVGGDFNMSETLDLWQGGPRGNQQYLDRMSELGLFALTPDSRNLCGGVGRKEMDLLFVNKEFGAVLSTCCAGSHDRVFGRGLSDHLPIIADFACEKSSVANG